MEYYSAVEEKLVINFALKWMELGRVILNEVTQIKKDKHHMLSFIHGSQLQIFRLSVKPKSDPQPS